jgi:hypothetical protein
MVNETASTPRLRGWLLMSLGVLGMVLGALWTLQGLDIVTESRMSGVDIWAVIGPVVAIAGLAMVIAGERVRARSKRKV